MDKKCPDSSLTFFSSLNSIVLWNKTVKCIASSISSWLKDKNLCMFLYLVCIFLFICTYLVSTTLLTQPRNSMLKKRQKPFPTPPWTSCVTSRFYVPPITETTEASFRDGLISNPKEGFGLYFLMTRCQAGYQGLTYRFEVIISPASCITAKEKKKKKFILWWSLQIFINLPYWAMRLILYFS